MDFLALEKHIIGIVSEQQIKLGYRSEVVRLYYPLESLNRIMKTEDSFMRMLDHLEEFSENVKSRLGKVEIESDGERFCLSIPPQGSDYVHACTVENGFLSEFINTIRQHGCTIEQILKVFRRYSDKVHFEQVKNGEFDYLIYFENGRPDEYRYCLTIEGGHLTYHRFTKDDYEELEK